MIHSQKNIAPSKDLLLKIEDRWQKALPFFKKKREVLFISDRYRFWEPPGFVQQSLAKTLCDEGVGVTWLDGMHWKALQSSSPVDSSLLRVGQIKCL
ncbi:MAG: hypothetical protein EBZ47_09160, partial [Chlamydiae bacterium]|nr:hypothetical protein [Chlamydiota bacterium]